MDTINDDDNNQNMTSININDDINVDITVNSENNLQNYFKFLKTILIFILIVINFPIIFCDLYYAVNDKTCVKQEIEKLALNMYDYLIVSGLYSLIITVISILFILFFIDKMKNNEVKTRNFFLFLFIISLFNVIWNIIGSLIFWHYMDNSQCSNQVFDYLFASLIIKLITCSSILFKSNKNE